MKKNSIVIFSSLLILTMFLSMFYSAFFRKNVPATNQSNENVHQHLRINIGSEPQTLHPGLSADSVSGSVISQTFEGLARKNVWGVTVNAAAKVIKISDDLKTYTFTLRDAKWSNGDPVIAQDFEYAWKWVLNPANKSVNADQLYAIKGAKEFHDGKGSQNEVGIRAIDDKTLEVELVKPNPQFIELTTLSTYFPIDSKVAKENPSWAKEDGKYYVTNGPYLLKNWNHNEEIDLKKNTNYWDEAKVKIESIKMLMVNDPSKELSLYEDGKLNVIGTSTKKITEEDVQLYSHSMTGLYKLVLNTNEKPFNNKSIRKALALAINRKELAKKIGITDAKPATALIPAEVISEKRTGYFKDNDVKKAQAYLQTGLNELGYHDVSELPSFTLSFSESGLNKEVAQTISDMWKENLGVTVRLDSSDLNTQNKNESTSGVSLITSFYSYNDPINILERNIQPLRNGAGWNNQEFDSLVKQAKVTMDKNQRIKLIKRAESALMDEMPIIPIDFYTTEIVQDMNLHDIAINSQGNLLFKWSWFE